jgi:hypothetical protein
MGIIETSQRPGAAPPSFSLLGRVLSLSTLERAFKGYARPQRHYNESSPPKLGVWVLF